MDLIQKRASLSLSLFVFVTCSSVGLALAVLAFMGKRKGEDVWVFLHIYIFGLIPILAAISDHLKSGNFTHFKAAFF